MPGKTIPSLGEAPEIATKLIQEEFPLPPKRPALLAALERVLASGGVQKLTVELGKPIKAIRRVPAALPGDEIPEELYEDDLMASVMNAEMESLVFTETLNPYELLFRAFNILTQKYLVPKTFLVNQTKQLQAWLKVTALKELFGIEVHQHKEIPDGVIVLVGAKADEPEVVEFSLRMEMVLPKEKK